MSVRFFRKRNKPEVEPADEVTRQQAPAEVSEPVVKPAHIETQFNALSVLSRTGFAPQTIFDVGANKGFWTRGCRVLYPEARYVLFEPQAELRDFMKDLEQDEQIEIHSIGLGREPGRHSFTLHDRDDSCSFTFSPEEAESRNFRQIELEIDALDNFIDKYDLPKPELLKIDAEGWDLEVLAGATRALEAADVVFVEANVCKQRNPNDLLTVMKFMDEQGFALVDFSDLNRPHEWKLLWLVECMFLRRTSRIYHEVSSYVPGAAPL